MIIVYYTYARLAYSLYDPMLLILETIPLAYWILSEPLGMQQKRQNNTQAIPVRGIEP